MRLALIQVLGSCLPHKNTPEHEQSQDECEPLGSIDRRAVRYMQTEIVVDQESSPQLIRLKRKYASSSCISFLEMKTSNMFLPSTETGPVIYMTSKYSVRSQALCALKLQRITNINAVERVLRIENPRRLENTKDLVVNFHTEVDPYQYLLLAASVAGANHYRLGEST